jgi:hypothetical protein
MTITVTYRSIDRVRMTRNFKTVEGARRFAIKWVGTSYDIGCGYAVSYDGIGKITVKGVTLAALFGTEPAAEPDHLDEQAVYEAAEYGDRPVRRFNGCRCCDQQLYRVGCDCGAEDEPAPTYESLPF